MVVIAIVAAFSTQFIVTAVDSYSTSKSASNLVNTGRTSIEQIARYLRTAVPNSVRVSATGNCLEVMPSVGGAFYESQVADSDNGAGLTSSVVIGALQNNEIYSSAVPSARVTLSSTTGSPITTLSFATPHRFNRNSINQRVFLGDQPLRFCVSGGALFLYENYGLSTASLGDGSPGGDSVLMANNVSAVGQAFTVSQSTEDRSTAVDISLNFSDGTTRVDLAQTVLVRNVP